jgi:hypothetical protein
MRRLLLLLSLLVTLPIVGGAQAQTAYAPYGCPPELASMTFPEPRACIDFQSWWQPAFNPSTFPTASMHVHMAIPFPYGERLVLPAAGQGYSWPYLSQFHNDVGGSVRTCRGGGFQFSDTIPKDPTCAGIKITTQDQRKAGVIPVPASTVNLWRSFVGQRENRFTTDTSSADGGKRQYQSCSCNASLNATGAAVSVRGRGWYQGGDYVDFSLKTPFRASTLQTGGLPSTLSYAIASGATIASAYIDPDFHHGSAGIVLFEYRAGSSGTFTLPALEPGNHRLVLVGIERVGAGASAGVLSIPFSR